MRHLLLALAIICSSLTSTTVWSDADLGSEKNAIQAVIADQLFAFAGDDNERAYFHMSLTIKHSITNANEFVDMIKQGYTALYEVVQFKFSRHTKVDQLMMQEVLIEDENGKLWQAFYALGKNQNDEWKISSVEIQPLKAKKLNLALL